MWQNSGEKPFTCSEDVATHWRKKHLLEKKHLYAVRMWQNTEKKHLHAVRMWQYTGEKTFTCSEYVATTGEKTFTCNDCRKHYSIAPENDNTHQRKTIYKHENTHWRKNINMQ